MKSSEQEHAVPRLLADIGGTNARFALLADGRIDQLRVLPCANYPSLALVIEDYLSGLGSDRPRPRRAAIAVACPVTDDRFKLTNLPWSVSIADTRAALAFNQLQVVNDLGCVWQQFADPGAASAVRGEAKPGGGHRKGCLT